MNVYLANPSPNNLRVGGMGFGRPGFGRPGFGRPGFGRPGFVGPWFGPFGGFGLPFLTGIAAGALLTPRPVPFPVYQPMPIYPPFYF